MIKFASLLATLLSFTQLLAEASPTPPPTPSVATNNAYTLLEFQVYNMARKAFLVRIAGKSPEAMETLIPGFQKAKKGDTLLAKQGLAENADNFYINDTIAFPIKKSLKKANNLSVTFFLYTHGYPKEGKGIFHWKSPDKQIDILSDEINIPPANNAINKQPLITRVYPAGGKVGDTITIYGKNLGKDIDKVQICFIDNEPDKGEPFQEKVYGIYDAFYLASIDPNIKKADGGTEVVKLTLPYHLIKSFARQRIGPKRLQKRFGWREGLLGHRISFYLLVNDRPTEVRSIMILPTHWKFLNTIVSLLLCAAFVTILRLIIGKWDFWHNILLDHKTNTYSLSNFQSFMWTITLIGCYFFVASAKMLILNDGELPSFDYSLLSLLGISYGGMLTSQTVNNKRKLNRIKARKPSYRDLISSENGDIDMGKLQLLGFTMLGIIIYVAYIFVGDSLLGLPAIPSSFQVLLLGSQGGYLGSQYTSKSISVEKIQPSVLTIGKDKKVSLIGQGFNSDMKVVIGESEPLAIELSDSTTIHVNLPDESSPTSKTVTLLTGEGPSIEVKDGITWKKESSAEKTEKQDKEQKEGQEQEQKQES
ncbi:MAG: IPT/TIG domain-containing protein [Spirochaetota bacterium]